jgi:hypothetical protein
MGSTLFGSRDGQISFEKRKNGGLRLLPINSKGFSPTPIQAHNL